MTGAGPQGGAPSWGLEPAQEPLAWSIHRSRVGKHTFSDHDLIPRRRLRTGHGGRTLCAWRLPQWGHLCRWTRWRLPLPVPRGWRLRRPALRGGSTHVPTQFLRHVPWPAATLPPHTVPLVGASHVSLGVPALPHQHGPILWPHGILHPHALVWCLLRAPLFQVLGLTSPTPTYLITSFLSPGWEVALKTYQLLARGGYEEVSDW